MRDHRIYIAKGPRAQTHTSAPTTEARRGNWDSHGFSWHRGKPAERQHTHCASRTNASTNTARSLKLHRWGSAMDGAERLPVLSQRQLANSKNAVPMSRPTTRPILHEQKTRPAWRSTRTQTLEKTLRDPPARAQSVEAPSRVAEPAKPIRDPPAYQRKPRTKTSLTHQRETTLGKCNLDKLSVAHQRKPGKNGPTGP